MLQLDDNLYLMSFCTLIYLFAGWGMNTVGRSYMLVTSGSLWVNFAIRWINTHGCFISQEKMIVSAMEGQ